MSVAAHVIGEDGLSRLRGPHADARLGLQRAHRELTRRFEQSLAERHGLSLSALDLLERRGLVQRRPCPEGTRATEAWITGAGGDLVRAAQADHLADVQRTLFDHLSDAELRTLGAVFTRLLEHRP